MGNMIECTPIGLPGITYTHMKKRKKRYLTANQIMEEIEKYQAKALSLQQRAELADKVAKDLCQKESLYEDGVLRSELAKQLRKSAARILDTRLPRLKQKLSEMNTRLLPGVIEDEDESVQA